MVLLQSGYLIALRDASGFAHIALRDAAVGALLADEGSRTTFLAAARQVVKLFKALLPDPAAAAHQHTVAAIRVLAERIAYNAGSLNIDVYLRRLVELSRTLTAEEQRTVAEGLTAGSLTPTRPPPAPAPAPPPSPTRTPTWPRWPRRSWPGSGPTRSSPPGWPSSWGWPAGPPCAPSGR